MKRSLQLLAMGAALLALLFSQSSSALAKGTTTIRDDAGVLTAADQQSIRNAAGRAPFVVTVVTHGGGFAGQSGVPDRTGFRRSVDSLVKGDVVIGLDPVDRLDHIAAASGTGLTSTALTNAESAAKSSFSAGRWGAGIVLAIESMAQASGPNGAQGAPAGQPASSGFPWGGIILVLAILGLVIVVVVLLARRRVANPPMYGPGFSPTGVPGQGPYPPGNYPPGYYPPGQPGGGLGGNILAGGLGAVGGGLIGYELGKEAGEHERYQQDAGYYDPGSGGGVVDANDGGADNFGGGSDGGGDFGGGGDSGGGGDF